MSPDSKNIAALYASRITAMHYDLPISHFFGTYKRRTFEASSLKKGDKVLVFCCGTGLDFPHILERIGSDGQIVGVDFSTEMLKVAEKKIKRNKWDNVELIEADVTEFKDKLNTTFDAGVCTLGISIIPDYKNAYYNLLSYIKPKGEIIIGDIQLAPGWRGRINPFMIFFGRRYGASWQGHQNSIDLCELIKKELSDVKKTEYFLRSYFSCIGKKAEKKNVISN